MRIIVITGKENEKKTRILLELPDKELFEKVKKLLNAWKWSEAISNIIANGKFIKELTENEIGHEKSDLILTDSNAYWNLL